jgi:hypothetical protein
MVAYAAPPDHYGQTAMGKRERREWGNNYKISRI